jgi:predicted RNA-binding Zn ribbon-like protein
MDREEMDREEEALLLELLNTTPVINGVARDDLATAAEGTAWLQAHGQVSTTSEWQALRDARDELQAVIRGTTPAAALTRWLDRVSRIPFVHDQGVEWRLDLPPGRAAAARAVLAWDSVSRTSPGRLRPCANPECQLFLVDHSKPNRARWCSMAVCGNRMKARRHYERERGRLRSEDVLDTH